MREFFTKRNGRLANAPKALGSAIAECKAVCSSNNLSADTMAVKEGGGELRKELVTKFITLKDAAGYSERARAASTRLRTP